MLYPPGLLTQLTSGLSLSVLCTVSVDFILLIAITGHFIRLSCFSYGFKVSILPYDLTLELPAAGFDYGQHDDCIVQGDGEVTMKCLLPAFSLEIGEVHVGCPFGVEQLVQLQGVVAVCLEVLVQLFDVQRIVHRLFLQS